MSLLEPLKRHPQVQILKLNFSVLGLELSEKQGWEGGGSSVEGMVGSLTSLNVEFQ